MAADLLHREVADLGAGAGEVDDLAAVDIDGRFPARGEGVGLLGPEIHRLDVEQDSRRDQRGIAVPDGGVTVRHAAEAPSLAHPS
jgi:hypothetical protein